ncbi:MAG TPA: glycosyltransferase [Verrucomicrobiaceae bacterium]|jgi:GT2 family glycosyltransferase
MITFIVLSRNPERLSCLEKSLHEAKLGSLQEWELLPVDGTKYDLFTGYNRGARQARGEILGFVHDDIEFWGDHRSFCRPVELLAGATTGFVGVVGTRLLESHGVWWRKREEMRGMLASASEDIFGTHWHFGPPWMSSKSCLNRAGLFGQVVVLDGIFLLCHRRTFDGLGGFDENSYRGFHFYDVDITFRATLSGLSNYVAPIPMYHPSTGTLNHEWDRNRRIFLGKFRQFLPRGVSTGNVRGAP